MTAGGVFIFLKSLPLSLTLPQNNLNKITKCSLLSLLEMYDSAIQIVGRTALLAEAMTVINPFLALQAPFKILLSKLFTRYYTLVATINYISHVEFVIDRNL